MTKQRKHTKKSAIKKKQRRMKQHAEENKAKTPDSEQLAKAYEPYSIRKRRLKRSGRIENE